MLLAPINTGFAESGRPTPRLLRFHRERSGPAVGASVVGNVAVAPAVRTNPRTLVLAADADVPHFSALADAIRAAGSLAGIQLAHSLAAIDPKPSWRSPDPAAEIKRLAAIVAALPEPTLDDSMDLFVRGTKLAVAAGFELVQIHGAHGYLLSLLLDPVINHRSDRYGYEGLGLDDALSNIRRAASGTILSIRISGYRGTAAADLEAGTTLVLAQRLAGLGVDLVDVSAGLYTLDRRMIYPSPPKSVLPNRDIALEIAARIGSFVSFAGNVLDPGDVGRLPSNVLVMVGRSLIADPAFLEKSRTGRAGDIVACVRHNHCHYFSRGRPHLECGANPDL